MTYGKKFYFLFFRKENALTSVFVNIRENCHICKAMVKATAQCTENCYFVKPFFKCKVNRVHCVGIILFGNKSYRFAVWKQYIRLGIKISYNKVRSNSCLFCKIAASVGTYHIVIRFYNLGQKIRICVRRACNNHTTHNYSFICHDLMSLTSLYI